MGIHLVVRKTKDDSRSCRLEDSRESLKQPSMLNRNAVEIPSMFYLEREDTWTCCGDADLDTVSALLGVGL